eukprot:scaffold26850_cov197-Isochrysis_galbana.AAC.2
MDAEGWVSLRGCSRPFEKVRPCPASRHTAASTRICAHRRALLSAHRERRLRRCLHTEAAQN